MYFAIVDADANKRLKKYQSFELLVDADAHVLKYGGFSIDDPGGDQNFWIVDIDAKTVTVDVAAKARDVLSRKKQSDLRLIHSQMQQNSNNFMSQVFSKFPDLLKNMPSAFVRQMKTVSGRKMLSDAVIRKKAAAAAPAAAPAPATATATANRIRAAARRAYALTVANNVAGSTAATRAAYQDYILSRGYSIIARRPNATSAQKAARISNIYKEAKRRISAYQTLYKILHDVGHSEGLKPSTLIDRNKYHNIASWRTKINSTAANLVKNSAALTYASNIYWPKA